MRIIYPKFFPLGCIHHNSPVTSFHGLANLWRERNYCEMVQSDNPFFWASDVGDTLLYTWYGREHLNPNQEYKAGLFANSDPPINGRHNLRWTFWPRHSFITEQYFRCKPKRWKDREISCVFIGGYENLTQRGNRFINYWKPAIDFLDWGIRGGNYTWQEYTRVLRNSRFGLCLPGMGRKCHREIECMAQGTIPIFTPGCSLEYHEPLEVGNADC